jgi:hypothetical protein
MEEKERQAEQEELEIGLLREWLSKIDGERRAYIKGASEALLYVQEGRGLNQGVLPEPGVSGSYVAPFDAAKGG